MSRIRDSASLFMSRHRTARQAPHGSGDDEIMFLLADVPATRLAGETGDEWIVQTIKDAMCCDNAASRL
jgi:hypothetical protein